jgi:hypothetical protein
MEQSPSWGDDTMTMTAFWDVAPCSHCRENFKSHQANISVN